MDEDKKHEPPKRAGLSEASMEVLREFAEQARRKGPQMPKPLPRRETDLEPRLGTPNTPSRMPTSDS